MIKQQKTETDSVLIKVFLDEEWQAVSSTIRWNSVPRNKDESLRDHLFNCGLFARLLLEELFIKDNRKITEFKLNALTASLFHDFDEVFTGDILHHVKYNKENGLVIKQNLELFAHKEFLEYFSHISDKNNAKKILLESVFNNKPEVKAFVKVVDWLACLYYTRTEQQLGNKYFDNYSHKCREKLSESIEQAKIELHYAFSSVNCNFSVFQKIRNQICLK